MSTLSVWRFDTPDGADNAVTTLERLSRQQLISVHDAATVSWQDGAKKPKTRQLRNLAGAGALGGAFWGMLFGLLFLVPLLGAAIGAAAGALAGSQPDDTGADRDNRCRTAARDSTRPPAAAPGPQSANASRNASSWSLDRLVNSSSARCPENASSTLSRTASVVRTNRADVPGVTSSRMRLMNWSSMP